MGFENKYGIKIVPVGLNRASAANYEHATRKHLAWIEGTKVGRLLLQGIGWHARNNPGNLAGGKIEIWPYIKGGCNSEVNNAVWSGTGWAQPLVNYSPDVFNKSGACYRDLSHAETNRGLYPDELLFHELVHAFRGAAARFKALPVSGGLVNYDATEEFIAVLMTNIYVSDPSNGSKTGLRQDHHGFKKLAPGLAGSFEFYRSSKTAFTLIDRFCTDHPVFTKWIAGVNAPFNPIAAYYGDKAKAQTYSNSAIALVRDGDWRGAMSKIMQDLLVP